MKRALIFSFALLCVFALLGGYVAYTYYADLSGDLPDIATIETYTPPLATMVYARDNSVIGYFYHEKRFPAKLEDMPDHLLKAFMAAEDARFYQHWGIDPHAIARAFISNMNDKNSLQGGSTITQQLVKRLLLTPERSYTRKAKEAILALRLEQNLSKDKIFELYLNEIYLGESAYGVEAAAQTYFAKHVGDLTVAESAVLATLPQAPSRYNPYRDPRATRERQTWVLGRMRDLGFIDQATYDQALNENILYRRMPDPSWTLGAWYLEEVRRHLAYVLDERNMRQYGIAMDQYGEKAVYEGGLHVYTAMEPIHQKAAEEALRSGLHQLDRRQGWRGSLRFVRPEGYEAFLQNTGFSPISLDKGGWVQALVTDVNKKEVKVALGNGFTGRISVDRMIWCRIPDPTVASASAPRINDAANVLIPGDVVYVSAVGALGSLNPCGSPADPDNPKKSVAPYRPERVRPGVPIELSLEQVPAAQGALVSIELASGDLVAIVGGYGFSSGSQFNRASQAWRQPGSAFKPIVYSAAADHGIVPETIVYDEPLSLPDVSTESDWRPNNSDLKFYGPIRAARALAASRNVCTVRVALQIGIENVVQRARHLGIPGNIPAVPAISLGSHETTPLFLTVAYSAFANQGRRVSPRIVTSIHNSRHEPIISFTPHAEQSISPENAYVISYMLKRAVNRGTGRAAKALNRPVAGKTGTTNNERDAWFIGYTPHLVTGVYVGHDQHMSLGKREYGAKAALPIFVDYRKEVEYMYPPDDFPIPPGIVWSDGEPLNEDEAASTYPSIVGVPVVRDAGMSLGAYDWDGGSEDDIWYGNELFW